MASAYVNALSKDPTLAKGSEVVACYSSAVAQTLLALNNKKDPLTTVTLTTRLIPKDAASTGKTNNQEVEKTPLPRFTDKTENYFNKYMVSNHGNGKNRQKYSGTVAPPRRLELSDKDSITVNPDSKKGAVALDLNVNDKFYVNSNEDGTVDIEFSSSCDNLD